MTKLIRITTIPISLGKLLKGQMHFMSENGYEVIAVSSPEETLNKVAETEGIRVVPIEMSRKITPWQDLKALWKAYRLFKKEKPRIVHSHTPKAGIVGMMAARMAGVPIRLHTVAGLPLMEATGVKRRLLDFVEKMTYRFATRVYPNSHGLKDFILQEKLCPEKKLHVIANGSSNGIDTAHFSTTHFSEEEKSKLRKELNISSADFVFIFIGRLVKDKGINELVSAFSKLRTPITNHPATAGRQPTTSHFSPITNHQSPTTKLLLVGSLESDLDPLLPETLDEVQSNKNIISVGYQDDVRPYLAIADALAFPSYREGFPNVVMQAGAMGLPSIVTDINGCNEIIIDKENGVIIPAKDEKALLGAMQFFLDNENEVKRMATNSRQLIVDRYEQRVVWEALLEEYGRLEKIFIPPWRRGN